jgi:hypothetical protein
MAAAKFHLTVLWAGDLEAVSPHADRIIELRDGHAIER